MAQVKNRIKKASPVTRIVSVCLGVVVLVFSGLLITNSIKELVSTAKLNQELNVVQSQLEGLQTEQASLSAEKTKLEDPAYVQNYARGTHLLSKSGEQVFILPKGE